MNIKKFGFLLIIIISIVTLIGCNNDSTTPAKDDSSSKTSSENEDKNEPTGGELRVALNASPPTLDQHITTAAATEDASRLIYEGLLSINSNFEPTPMLAESVEVSDDSKTYTFNLREGVMFHNNKEMIAEDVVASMKRWIEHSTVTGNTFDNATWEATDDYTVVLQMEKASPLVLYILASPGQAAGIMPKEIIESAPAEGVEEYIGTGPFKYVDWKPEQYIHYEKFDQYQSVDMEADGLIGEKMPLVDDIYIHIVPDTSTRIAGMKTGEYHIAYDIPYDQYDDLEADPNLSVIVSNAGNALVKFNTVEGLASDFKIREAINTGIDIDAIMMAGFPNKDFYILDSSYMHKDIVNWRSDAGEEYYNQNNPEKAKDLLDEMGYDGEEFRIMTTRDYDYMYNIGVVLHEELQNIGINSKLEVYDWPTVTDLRENDTSAWEVFISGAGATSTPLELIALSPSWGSGVNSEYVNDMMEQIRFASTDEEAVELWDKLQLYAWKEHLPVINLGGLSKLYAVSEEVNGFEVTLAGTTYWNVTVDQ